MISWTQTPTVWKIFNCRGLVSLTAPFQRENTSWIYNTWALINFGLTPKLMEWNWDVQRNVCGFKPDLSAYNAKGSTRVETLDTCVETLFMIGGSCSLSPRSPLSRDDPLSLYCQAFPFYLSLCQMGCVGKGMWNCLLLMDKMVRQDIQR